MPGLEAGADMQVTICILTEHLLIPKTSISYNAHMLPNYSCLAAS
jgi:hypothetical protein